MIEVPSVALVLAGLLLYVLVGWLVTFAVAIQQGVEYTDSLARRISYLEETIEQQQQFIWQEVDRSYDLALASGQQLVCRLFGRN